MKIVYDDCGIKCRINSITGDIEPCEPHCLRCGYSPSKCNCTTYTAGEWFDEKTMEFTKAKVTKVTCIKMYDDGFDLLLTFKDGKKLSSKENEHEYISEHRGNNVIYVFNDLPPTQKDVKHYIDWIKSNTFLVK